jgi:hypothetical protein
MSIIDKSRLAQAEKKELFYQLMQAWPHLTPAQKTIILAMVYRMILGNKIERLTAWLIEKNPLVGLLEKQNQDRP